MILYILSMVGEIPSIKRNRGGSCFYGEITDGKAKVILMDMIVKQERGFQMLMGLQRFLAILKLKELVMVMILRYTYSSE